MSLASIGRWLQTRFPERKVVGDAEFNNLLLRIENLEKNSVHVDAVKALVMAVKDVKDEFATVRTGLGLNSPKAAELQAMLNGQPIHEESPF